MGNEKGVNGMDESFGIGKAILVGIGAGIVFPLLMLLAMKIGNASEREYLEKGVLKPCFVETVVVIRGKQQVYVIYQNDRGERIRAKAVLNKMVAAGETVEAYVLESEPYEVYYPGAPIWKVIIYILMGLFVVGAWIPLVVLLIMRRRDNQTASLTAQLKAMNQKRDDIDI